MVGKLHDPSEFRCRRLLHRKFGECNPPAGPFRDTSAAESFGIGQKLQDVVEVEEVVLLRLFSTLQSKV
jgi:hypothetical protein